MTVLLRQTFTRTFRELNLSYLKFNNKEILNGGKYSSQIWFQKLTGLHTSSLLSIQEKLRWSYLQGESDEPLVGITIGKLFQEVVETYPDKEAVIFHSCGVRRTFSQLMEEVDSFAAGLMRLGFKKGDRVGIWSPNYLEWVITQYATARLGIILVNINPAYRVGELEYALKKVGVKAIVCAESFKTSNYYKMLHEICPELGSCKPGELKSKRLPLLNTVIMKGENYHLGTFRFTDVMQMGSPADRSAVLDLQNKLQFDDPINIQFTSGTTGSPKGATLTHHNVVNNCRNTGRRVDYHKKDARIALPVPLYHCFGMVLASLQGPVYASTVVYPSPTFDPGMALEAIERHQCTALYGTPTMFIDILHHPEFEKYDVSSLYTGIMAGSPCPVEVMKQVVTKLNMNKMTIAYGTTENSPVTFQGYMDDSLEKQVSTIGRPGPHIEAKVVDSEGCIVPVGEKGELCTRGYTTMRYYWDDPEKTKECIDKSRWYHTGDIATIDEDGYGQIVGRIKDMVIRGGENIYPVEIEHFIYEHPKVNDVQVVGVPDPRMGEELCAYIKLKDGEKVTEQEIKDFCKEKIAHFKIPRYIVFVHEYPMTVTGKIQKYKIREDAIMRLGLE